MKKFFLIFILATLPAGAHAAATRIGAAGGVNGLVRATAPGEAEARVIKSGAPLFLNDRVTTDANGKMQIMLLDETVFTIGANSDLTLDEFVYDPATSAGKVSARMTKGVFRFVTGKVARKDPANMKVKLSVGTIGIRGTIVGGRADDNSATVILLGPGAQNNANETPGAITVGNGSNSVFIDQPGFGVNLTQGQGALTVSDMSRQAAQLASELSSGAPGEGGGPVPAPGGNGGQGPVGEAAGQATAQAGSLLANASGLGQTVQQLGNTTSAAVQDLESQLAFPDGISTWDQVRSIETGLVYYAGTGLASLVGSAGPPAEFYDVNFNLVVDFGAREYGGGTSAIDLTAQVGGSYFAGTNIEFTSFAALPGPDSAAIILQSNSGNSSNASFDGSTILFNNSGGSPATSLSLAVHYDDGVNTGVGTAVTGPPEIYMPN